MQVLQEFQAAEKLKKPSPTHMLTDVYEEMPVHLQRQMDEMKKHVEKHKEHYPLDQFEEMKWDGVIYRMV